MSCFPEYRYAIYVDGELGGETLREIQEHLVGCARCRALVVALEEEASLLGDVLHDRTPAWREAVRGRARARGVAAGLAPALGVVALVTTIGGWLLERELPSGVGWLSPLTFIGATEMLFDLVFVARDRAPELFDLAVAVGGMAAFAALAAFLTSALTERLGRGLAPLLVFLTVFVPGGMGGDAQAFELRHEKGDIRIGAAETFDETLVASGENVTIDGTIDGDLVALGERVVLNGKVTGNLYAAGREVEVRGEVGGAAHVGGERVDVEGRVARGLYGVAETLTLREQGSVGWDAVLAGEHVRANGRAGRDLITFADEVEIRGGVARNASAYGGALVVHREARIAGDLDVRLPEGEAAQIEDEASVGGEIRQGILEHENDRNRWTNPHFYLVSFVLLVSAFLVGMALHWTVPAVFSAPIETSADFFRCLGLGFVGLVATPIFLVLCLVTIVGIPIGIIGFFVYLTTLFASLIVVSALVGSAVFDREAESAYAFGSALLVGLLIVIVAVNLPFLGDLVKILVLLTGLGLVLTSAYEAWQRGRGPRIGAG